MTLLVLDFWGSPELHFFTRYNTLSSKSPSQIFLHLIAYVQSQLLWPPHNTISILEPSYIRTWVLGGSHRGMLPEKSYVFSYCSSHHTSTRGIWEGLKPPEWYSLCTLNCAGLPQDEPELILQQNQVCIFNYNNLPTELSWLYKC